MEISELQRYVKEFSTAKGFDHNTIETRALYLMTEVGELSKEVIHLHFRKDPDQVQEIKERLGLEMFDVVWNVVDLANKLGINLEEAFNQKIEINKHRKW